MSPYPEKEPKSEQFVSELTGLNLEALSALAASQDYHSDGPWLSTAAQDLLFGLGSGSRPGRFGLRGGAPAELEQAGLVTARGRLTGQGRLVTSVLENTEASFVISGGFRAARTSLQCVLGPEGILVLAGPSCASLRNGKDLAGVRQLDFLSMDQLPPALAAWTGIGPGWALDGTGLPTAEQLQARMDGAAADAVPPPSEADAVMQHMWAQDWFIWQVSGAGPGLPTGIQAGPAGTWKITRTPEGPVLGAWPSGAAYRSLLDFLAAAMAAGPGGRQRAQR